MKVWVVESGEYSSRDIVGVYSSEENARLAARDADDISPYDLDQNVDRYQSGLRVFNIEMDRDGNVLKAENWGYSTMDRDTFHLSSGKILNAKERYVLDRVDAIVWAEDQQHAIKITNERRAQLLASGQWDHQQQEFDERYPLREHA